MTFKLFELVSAVALVCFAGGYLTCLWVGDSLDPDGGLAELEAILDEWKEVSVADPRLREAAEVGRGPRRMEGGVVPIHEYGKPPKQGK